MAFPNPLDRAAKTTNRFSSIHIQYLSQFCPTDIQGVPNALRMLLAIQWKSIRAHFFGSGQNYQKVNLGCFSKINRKLIASWNGSTSIKRFVKQHYCNQRGKWLCERFWREWKQGFVELWVGELWCTPQVQKDKVITEVKPVKF